MQGVDVSWMYVSWDSSGVSLCYGIIYRWTLPPTEEAKRSGPWVAAGWVVVRESSRALALVCICMVDG